MSEPKTSQEKLNSYLRTKNEVIEVKLHLLHIWCCGFIFSLYRDILCHMAKPCFVIFKVYLYFKLKAFVQFNKGFEK